MITYKLFRQKGGKLYPLFVEVNREMPVGIWLEAGIGELADEGHVWSRLGLLALRPGFHSTEVPFTDWIGKRPSKLSHTANKTEDLNGWKICASCRL